MLDLDQQSGKRDVHERVGWVANMLVGGDEAAAKKAVNECKQQNKSKNYLFINVV